MFNETLCLMFSVKNMFFPLKIMRNIFLLSTYSALLLVPSIVVKTVFWYLDNNLSYWLQMCQHEFSQAEETTSKMAAPGHCFFKDLVILKDILHKFNHGEYYISMTQLNFFYSLSQYKLNQAIGLNLVAIEWISILLFF